MQCDNASSSILAAMYEPIEEVIAPYDKLPLPERSHSKPCSPQQQRVGIYIFHLRTVKGLPPFQNNPTEHTIRRLERLYESQYAADIAAIKKCRGECKYCEVDFLQDIKDTIILIDDKVGFMCLKCVKAGNFELRLEGCMQHEK